MLFALTGSVSNVGLLEIKYVALTAVPRKILRRDKKVVNPFFASSCFVCIHFTQLLFLNKLYNVRPSLWPNVALYLASMRIY